MPIPMTPEQQAELDAGLDAALSGSANVPDPDNAFIVDAPPPGPVEGEAPVDELDPKNFDENGNLIDPPPADGQPPADTPPAEKPEGEKPEGEAPPADGEKPPEGKDGKDAKDGKAGKEGEQPAADSPEEDAAIAASLSGRAKARMEKLSSEVSTLRTALEEAGVTDVSQLKAIAQRAADGNDMIKMVMDTGMSGDQYGQVLDYMGAFNTAVTTNDAKAAKGALDMLLPAVQQLASIAGMDIATTFASSADPLSAHPDLAKLVEEGDLSRALAMEQVRARAMIAGTAARADATAQATRAETEQAQALDWLRGFDAHMTANDPSYQAKRATLNAAVAVIRETLPPAQWAEATKRAYARIPAPAAVSPPPPPPPAAPRVKVGPVRPSGNAAAMVPEFTDPAQALEAGLAAASRGG